MDNSYGTFSEQGKAGITGRGRDGLLWGSMNTGNRNNVTGGRSRPTGQDYAAI